jgi:hypothetical protein
MERKERPTVLYTDKYDRSFLAQFIIEKDYCDTADNFIRKTLSDPHALSYELTSPGLLYKTKELPLLSIKGDSVDTTRVMLIYEGKSLVEFVFNSGKCHYSISPLHSIHRLERTDYSLIVVTQNAVVPCADIILFGKYQFSYRFSIEGQQEVEELDKFMAKLREAMMKKGESSS